VRFFKAAEESRTAELTLIFIRIGHSDPVSDSRGYQPQNLYKPQPSGTAFLRRSDSSKDPWSRQRPSAAHNHLHTCTQVPAPAALPEPSKSYGNIFSPVLFEVGFFLPSRKPGWAAKCVYVAMWKL